jgi:MazG family protein
LNKSTLEEMQLSERENAIAASLMRFYRIVKQLRDPEEGCPWDLQQSHATLAPYMVEEALEAYAVMRKGSPVEIREELGDVLLQVVLNSVLAEQGGDFNLSDVATQIAEKMKERHPHVFLAAKAEWDDASVEGARAPAAALSKKWNQIKHEDVLKGGIQALEQQLIKVDFPATKDAERLGKLAAAFRFDWPDGFSVWHKLLEELGEIKEALESGDKLSLEDEIGDLFFCAVQLCRVSQVKAEAAFMAANEKFKARFFEMMQQADADGLDFIRLSDQEKEEKWQQAKRRLKERAG